jgi:hypothetical protein
MTLNQKALALLILLVFNVAVLLFCVTFAGLFGLVHAAFFFALSGAATWRILSM